MNVITLSGNICKDIELRYSKEGNPILSNTIAVRKDKKKEDGTYDADFVNIVLFGNNAEFISKYAKKGDKISLVGKIRVDKWQDEEGNYHYNDYVVADKVELMTNKNDR